MPAWLIFLAIVAVLLYLHTHEGYTGVPARFQIGSHQSDVPLDDPRVQDVIERDNGLVYRDVTDTAFNLELARAVDAPTPPDAGSATAAATYAQTEPLVRRILASISSASRVVELRLVDISSKGSTLSGAFVVQAQALEIRLNAVRTIVLGFYADGRVFRCELLTDADAPGAPVAAGVDISVDPPSYAPLLS